MLANDILALRASPSVEKSSGPSNLSTLGDAILEDIPRPVPMHTLLKVRQLQETCDQHRLTLTLCYGRTSTRKRVILR